jgi:hypothetical protein
MFIAAAIFYINACMHSTKVVIILTVRRSGNQIVLVNPNQLQKMQLSALLQESNLRPTKPLQGYNELSYEVTVLKF